MQWNFSNKVVRLLSAGGASVVVADFDIAKAEAMAGSLPRASAFAVDVADPVAVKSMVEHAVQQFGALHLAVNNAGIGGEVAPVADHPLEAWRRVMGVNLDGVFYGMKYQIPAILAAGGGAIVNMSSILGTNGWAGSCAYVAAKHALQGLTKTAALEYAAQGLRVNAVGPAFIDTPLIAAYQGEVRDQLIALHPAGRLGRSEEVAALTCFLLTEEAAFINGSYHLVDGGFSAR
jgi:NAD(P)-dependent dehydrogenase (short-subunit alcohol dehydrogenase family)